MFTKVLPAHNGRELVEAALRERPAVIVTDNDMPLMSGSEAVRAVRQELSGVRVVIMTADDETVLEEITVRKSSRTFVRDLCTALDRAFEI